MAYMRSISGSIVFDLLVLAALCAFSWSWYRTYQRLKHIPGPKSWGWTVLPLFKSHVDGTIHDDFEALTVKYGPVVRIAPRTVLVADPDVIRKMSAARSPYTRAPWYRAMQATPGIDNIFSTLDEPVHAEKRRKMSPAYSGRELPTLEADIDGCLHQLIDLIDRKYITADPAKELKKLNLGQKMQFFTSDTISKIAFDDIFHDLRDDNDNHGYIREVEALFPPMVCLTTIPSFLKALTLSGIAKLMAPSAKNQFGLGKVLFISANQARKRFISDGKTKVSQTDMLASFVRHGLTQEEAEQEGVIQLAGGSDTTATALRTALLCIISNPRILATLRTEIDTAVKARNHTTADIISDDQAKSLPYLQAIIKESLRWLPPATGMLAKLTPPAGDTICGYFIPGNISIAYSGKYIHRLPALYNPDPAIFRPERWIHPSIHPAGQAESLEKVEKMERNNELVFGYGRYSCLGKNVAFIELNKVIFELVRRFDFEVCDPMQAMKSRAFGIHLQSEFFVVARRREVLG